MYRKRKVKKHGNEIHGDPDTCAGEGIPLWKRALDIVCITAAAPVWLPVGLFVAGLIKVVSPGPALFRQERVGHLGRRFGCLKFRTMVVNADTSVHRGHLEDLMNSNCPMTKLDKAGDARLIPCGLFLRTLGLDELPQLINVLKGEMSLVGPRPCLPYEYDRYLPRHRKRCAALPGLTGLWQTSGKNKTTFEEMIELDVYYAKHKSLLMDLKIIMMTIPALMEQASDVNRANKETVRPPVGRVGVRRIADQQF